jgi:hypothetical protein
VKSEGGIKQSKVRLFEYLAEFFDLEYELLTPPKEERDKTAAKQKTIRAFEGKKIPYFNNSIKIRKPKNKDGEHRDVGKKIALIEEVIDDKLARQEKLTRIEQFWMTYRRDFYVRISKHTYKNERVYSAINKVC